MQEVPGLAEAFAETLRRFRTQAHLTQRELAERIGGTSTYIYLLERGKKTPTLKAFFLLCSALDADVHEFLDEYFESQARLSSKPE